jgi:hypothetical protein
VADVLAEYKEKQQKSYSVEQRSRLHLKPFFTKRSSGDITTDKIRRYTKQRRRESQETSNPWVPNQAGWCLRNLLLFYCSR